MENKILVVGAGPVGLSGALFLREKNFPVQIVERLNTPVKESKALAVNPRTLEILESSGITRTMLTLGLKILGASIWRQNGELATQIKFSSLHARYPYLLALSQAVTERLLTEALDKKGVAVERGIEVLGCENQTEDVKTKFADGRTVESKYVLAADGAHSSIRSQQDVAFRGTSYLGKWYLVDVALRTKLRPDHAHVIFRDKGGFYFLVRVVQDITKERQTDPIWRVISTSPDPLKDLKVGIAVSSPIWSSEFNVAHRINERLQDGSIFFAGDAAHIHSPVGARGMNLGIEDAWTFADLLGRNQINQYGELRKSVDQGVVHRVDLISRIAMGDQAYVRAIRNFILPEAVKLEPVRNFFIRALSGLDHPL